MNRRIDGQRGLGASRAGVEHVQQTKTENPRQLTPSTDEVQPISCVVLLIALIGDLNQGVVDFS